MPQRIWTRLIDVTAIAGLAVAPVSVAQTAGDEAAPAAVQPAKEAARRRRPPGGQSEGLQVKARLDAAAGGLTGYQVRRESGALAAVAAGVELIWALGALTVEVPLQLGHRQTFGARLQETRGRAAFDLSWKLARGLRASASARLGGAWRPGWNDLYQPLGGGAFVATSRYSYLEPQLAAGLRYSALRDHTFSLRYELHRPDYLDDPSFAPVDEPTHLVPSDHLRHEVVAAWLYDLGAVELGGRLEGAARYDQFLIARDAGTGRTHAGAGGEPANPLQVLYALEPVLEAELSVARVVLQARYGFEVVVDAFQGYYSFTGHHPRLRARWAATDALALRVTGELWAREYGPNAYAAGTSRPPLDFGTTRSDRRGVLSLDGELRVSPELFLTLEVEGTSRETNFPDYVPFVFPRTRGYDIDWDYSHLRAAIGVSYRL